jgi:hypothetical protein
MKPGWWFAGSCLTWTVGWELVGWERPLRMLAAMGLVIASGWLSDCAFRAIRRRERAEEARLDAMLAEMDKQTGR